MACYEYYEQLWVVIMCHWYMSVVIICIQRVELLRVVSYIFLCGVHGVSNTWLPLVELVG